MLKGAEESGMIGENIEGFISCMGSGVSGVSDPPAMTMLWEWDRWLIVSIDCGEGAGQTQWRRKVERFPSFYVPCLASRRPDKSCLIAVFVWNLTWENGPSGGSAQDKWLADNMSGQHFLKDASVGIKDFWSWKRNCLSDILTKDARWTLTQTGGEGRVGLGDVDAVV